MNLKLPDRLKPVSQTQTEPVNNKETILKTIIAEAVSTTELPPAITQMMRLARLSNPDEIVNALENIVTRYRNELKTTE